MCGIVGAVAQRDVAEILLEGLKRLEYRGYDSAGIAVIKDNAISRVRRLGKVKELSDALQVEAIPGATGIAHTRWATHGEPSEVNAHPHISGQDIAIVHNGIIENYQELKEELKGLGYEFFTETDTEVMAHKVAEEYKATHNLLKAVQNTVLQLKGAYGAVFMHKGQPDELIVARSGSPLVIGKGIGEMFVASDQLALLPVTRQFVYLEEGEVARVTRTNLEIFNESGKVIERQFSESTVQHDSGDKGPYRHFMLKEIYEQADAVSNTIEGRIISGKLNDEVFGVNAKEIFEKLESIQIVACGTSYHAGMVAKYWCEEIANIPCQIEIASEYRYRKSFVPQNALFVTISQSGETADTLAALRQAKQNGFMSSLVICNVPGSSLVRESEIAFMTRAGAEIGVASTKAFTTQLVSLLMLIISIAKQKGVKEEKINEMIRSIEALPGEIKLCLQQDETIETLAEDFSEKNHSLFLGRGEQYPIAMEGALKLKEISYIHAEAYAAGELKHGPLALIDHEMPIVVVAPENELLEKLKSNMEEVRARGGQLYVFAGDNTGFKDEPGMKVISISSKHPITAPIIFTIPLQLLSYHVAIIKGTDVDQPRNLAKSVTVE